MASRKKASPRAASSPGRPGEGPDPFRLVRYSHIFSSAIREILETSLLREATPLPLSQTQFQLLKLMAINGRHQIGDVAQFLGVSAPAATKNIDKLERLGLVRRSPLEGDRRATMLSVSLQGRKLVRRYEELKTDRLAPILESFTPEEISRFTTMLRRFAVSLYETAKPSNGACLKCSAYIEEGCPLGHVRGGCPYQDARKARTTQEVPQAN